jgi:hypothetical protein
MRYVSPNSSPGRSSIARAPAAVPATSRNSAPSAPGSLAGGDDRSTTDASPAGAPGPSTCAPGVDRG